MNSPSVHSNLECFLDDDMAQWVQREYKKGEIDRAAVSLLPWWTHQGTLAPQEIGRCYTIVQNWRTSHAFPLNTFQISLRRRALRLEKDAIIAQRLKRFISLMNKLAREPNMKLSQMQDLGGCRAILSSVEAVYKLYNLYAGGPPLFDSQGSLKCYDYIREPKEDGYRSIHVVGRYHARVPNCEPWNGQRIEIQLRSRLQHAFATAVETVTTFTREPLKFGGGPLEWKRFFSLMGSALAVREGTPLVPGTPTDAKELFRELRETALELNVQGRLRGWTAALHKFPARTLKGFKWLLLSLDLKENTFRATGYADRKKATEEIARLEQEKNPYLDVVLVWVGSAKQLREAYPNYYADTHEFLSALSVAVRTYPEIPSFNLQTKPEASNEV